MVDGRVFDMSARTLRNPDLYSNRSSECTSISVQYISHPTKKASQLIFHPLRQLPADLSLQVHRESFTD